MRVCSRYSLQASMKTMSMIMGEVIHVMNIMKCMDSDIMYVINVYNDIWNATYYIPRIPQCQI